MSSVTILAMHDGEPILYSRHCLWPILDISMKVGASFAMFGVIAVKEFCET